MTKKKVLLVTGVFPPGIGGMQTYYYQLCKHSNQQMSVIAPYYVGDEAFDAQHAIPVMRAPFFKNEKFHLSSIWNYIRYTRRAMRKVEPEVTIYGYVALALFGWFQHVFTGKPYVVSTHGKDMLEFKKVFGLRHLAQMILRRANGVIANTQYTRGVVESLGVDPARIQLIYPGVESIFEPQEKNEELMRKHDLTGKYVLLTAGRLVLRKGHDKVIEALPEMVKHIPNIVYVIVGDGPQRKHLERLAAKLNVEQHVVFAGYAASAEQLIQYYNVCDQFIMVSRELKGDVEGFGIVYLEAASCRKAAIAGNSGGVSEAVVDGETGLLVDPESEREIAEAVIRLYRDPQYKESLAQAGYERAKSSFQYEQLSSQLDTYLDQITN